MDMGARSRLGRAFAPGGVTGTAEVAADVRAVSVGTVRLGHRRCGRAAVPAVEGRVVARVPRLAEPGRREVPVGTDLACDGPQVLAEVLDRGASPEPVAVVDLVDDEARLEHERVRDHRVV